jgi:hypothetical protein
MADSQRIRPDLTCWTSRVARVPLLTKFQPMKTRRFRGHAVDGSSVEDGSQGVKADQEGQYS